MDVSCGYGTFRAGAWPSACWRPYGDESPFNQRVPANPSLHPNSRRIVDGMMERGPVSTMLVGTDTPNDWNHPYYFSGPSDPVYTIRCTQVQWGRCSIEGMQVRIPAAARAAGGSDRHMAVIDQSSGWEYDFWQVHDKPRDGGILAISWGGRTRIEGDGLGSNATAAHFGLLAGIIRAPEMEARRIDHALFMMTRCTARNYVYPARGLAYTCADPANAPSVGQHLWLDMSEHEINALPVPEWKKTILRALAEYGAFIGDTGGRTSFSLQFESGSTYTSFGLEDRMAKFARDQAEGVSFSNGTYYFDLESGVDWRGRLRVLDPCVAARTC